MKIADVAEFYSPQGGGVRTYIHEKLKASARLGHETIIIAPGPEDREDVVPGGKIVWVKAPVLPVDPRYHVFWGAAPVHAVLAREAPDVVEGSSPWRGGWIAGAYPGKTTRVLFMHSDPVASYPHNVLGGLMAPASIDRLFGWFWAYLRRLNARFDVTVVSGGWLARRLESFGLRGLHAVPFGVDRTLFNPTMRSEGARRKMLTACGLDDDSRLLIAVGRHHPEKRLDTLIDAVAHANNNARVGLYIVGDGLARTSVERKARGVKHVCVAGQVGDRREVATLVASADALIHGCGNETYGLAVAEALCSGTPIIVPNTGGAADLAGAGYSEVYRPGDSAAAALAIRRLMARDRASLSASALEAAAARVGSADAHFDKLFALYETLAAKSR